MTETNVIPFEKPVRKGLGYEPPPPGDWLSEMPLGTRFLAKPRTAAGSRLTEFVVAAKISGVVLLGENINGKGLFDWHLPELFSQDHKYYLTLEVLEAKDGNSNILQPAGMVGHAHDQEGDS